MSTIKKKIANCATEKIRNEARTIDTKYLKNAKNVNRKYKKANVVAQKKKQLIQKYQTNLYNLYALSNAKGKKEIETLMGLDNHGITSYETLPLYKLYIDSLSRYLCGSYFDTSKYFNTFGYMKSFSVETGIAFTFLLRQEICKIKKVSDGKTIKKRLNKYLSNYLCIRESKINLNDEKDVMDLKNRQILRGNMFKGTNSKCAEQNNLSSHGLLNNRSSVDDSLMINKLFDNIISYFEMAFDYNQVGMKYNEVFTYKPVQKFADFKKLTSKIKSNFNPFERLIFLKVIVNLIVDLKCMSLISLKDFNLDILLDVLLNNFDIILLINSENRILLYQLILKTVGVDVDNFTLKISDKLSSVRNYLKDILMSETASGLIKFARKPLGLVKGGFERFQETFRNSELIKDAKQRRRELSKK